MPAALHDARPNRVSDPFGSLNDEQRRAVFHGKGAAPAAPLLLVAGAGSGKTMTLAARVARLVLDGADPRRILLLTFSRRAAAELCARAGRTLHQTLGLRATQRAPQLPWAGTFHGVAARLLREHAARIGLSESFTIVDRADAEDLLGLARQDLGLAATVQRFPLKGTCLAIYSRAVNAPEPLAQVLQQRFPWCSAWETELKTLFRRYAADKQRQAVLDYDDLLLYWWQALADASLAAEMGARFDHVLVDEYQDTNRLQAEILLLLKPDGRGVAVVGDDAQSIYSFRAAEARNLLDFPAQFDPPAQWLTLQRNYRSTPPILDASNAVIARAAERFTKTLWTERSGGARPQLVHLDDEAAQATHVADEVLRQREEGVLLRRQAVLFRTSHHSTALELELARRNVPFVKFGGLKFLEAAHVKDLLAVLRWSSNPRCRIAGFRVALLVAGIGPASARKLLDAMQAAADPRAALYAFTPPKAAASAWHALADCLRDLQAAPWPAPVERALRWVLPQLQRLHDDAAIRARDLDQLQRLAAGHASCADFLAELTLDPPEATSDEAQDPHLDEDTLILSTIHAAKGREWAAVYVLNVVDGCIPSDMATGSTAEIEEERRLLYVAMTRARDRLQLLVPQRFHVHQQPAFGDRHVYGSLSRFVPDEVAVHFDRVVTARAVDAMAASSSPGPSVDVGAQLRALWD